MKKLEFESGGFQILNKQKNNRSILRSGEEIPLPQEIIQHIQSFLNGKEAAESSILSQSWHDAWLTRPDLDLNQDYFPCGGVEQLLDMAKKTIQRHEDRNLSIDTLRLLMDTKLSHHHISVAKKLLAKAMKLGVVDLDITSRMNPFFVLPVEVLQSETLARLSLHGGMTFDLADLTCPNLKSLCVTSLPVTADVFRDLIARHPLIERLKLDFWWPFALSGDKRKRMSSTINNWINLQDDHQFEFHKLEYIYLGKLIVEGNLFVHANATRFPFLKELVIWNCIPKSWDYRDMCISSTSLELITIGFVDEEDSIWTWGPDHLSWNAEFDVPNIRKFEFEGCTDPVIAFKGTSREWESNIRVRCFRPTAEWFISLNQLLQKFSLSKVCLSIDFLSLYKRFEIKNMNIGVLAAAGLHAPELECLRTEGYELNPAVFDVLFLICRPKMIILHCLDGKLMDGYLLELVCRRLIEEVNVEVFEEDCDEWRFVPWKSILDASTCEHRLVRFQLKWRLELSAPIS